MRTHIAGITIRTLPLIGGFALGIAGTALAITPTPVQAQSVASSGSRVMTGNDSARAGDERSMLPLRRIIELDSALAMSALPRLRLEATRDLARATVINHRATGDSMRAGTTVSQRGAVAKDVRYKSRLEDHARRMLPNKNVDIAYVIHAIALQQAALRMIDEQVSTALQSEAARKHIATARLNTLERLRYSEELRRELSGQRTTGR